jgi:antitoxin component YwqK of YwqJK toxin-antitoxin module
MKATTAVLAFVPVLSLLLAGCGKERIVSKYPNGKPKLIRTYNPLSIVTPENVRRQQTFFYNGNPESDSYYRDGILHGPYADFWTNGQKKTVGKYRAGKKEGDWESYYNQFTLSSKGAYKNDVKEGTWYGFWENGALKSQSLFAAGKETGTTKEWSAKGEPTAENSCFEANPRGNYVSYYANKTPKEQYECRSGIPYGNYRKQDPDGAVMERGVFDIQGRKDSVWETFHPNGKPASIKRYLGGLEQDSSYAWDEAGRLTEKARFDSGSGERLAYDTLGHLIERRRFLKGQPDGECWIYWPQGGKRSLVNYRDGKPVDMHKWHPNGKPMADGIFANGHRSGEWKDWYETGVLKEISHFQDGALHGERQFFDPKGKLIRSLRYEHGFPADGKIPKGLASPGSLNPIPDSAGAGATNPAKSSRPSVEPADSPHPGSQADTGNKANGG